MIISAGSSKVEQGIVPATDITLYWAPFTDAADEAGISRRYGGIHFSDGDLNARKVGRALAQKAWKKTLRHFGEHKGRNEHYGEHEHNEEHEHYGEHKGMKEHNRTRNANEQEGIEAVTCFPETSNTAQ